jgi:hypothetical protein
LSKGDTSALILIKPTIEYLTGYMDALKRGWSPDNMREAARLEELEWIRRDRSSFLESLEDRRAKADPVRLPMRITPLRSV